MGRSPVASGLALCFAYCFTPLLCLVALPWQRRSLRPDLPAGSIRRAKGCSVQSADIVIVGNGIVGSAAAYFLSSSDALRGCRIIVVERDPALSYGSTSRSAGGLRQQFSTPENIAMSQFTLAMFRRLKSIFGPTADVAFREQGYLLLTPPESRVMLTENITLQQSMHADVALMETAHLAQQFPWLAVDGIGAGGLGRSGEGWFDPPSLAALLREAASAHGVKVLHDSVTTIIADNRVRRVHLASGAAMACGRLINAAGPWAGDVARLAGVRLPVEPRKRYVYVIDCRHAPPQLRGAPLTVDPTGAWFRPEGRYFLCGLSPPENTEPCPADLDHIDHRFFEAEVWPRLAARVPAFESVKVVNAWAGFYDVNTLDHNAIIGAHPDLANFYFVNGFSGHGAQHAPAAGRAIAELIAHGAFQTIDLSRFGYGRIATGKPLRERNVI
jgi:FAD-dependent oxidoreductase domain-containing protein 1